MPKTAMIRARVEPGLKHRAESILEELGLTTTTAITLFYRQIVQRRGLPFDLRLPNATTQRAMKDARSGRGVVEAGSMDELFTKLGKGDERKAARPKRRKRRTPG